MKMVTGSVVLIAAGLTLSACGGSHMTTVTARDLVHTTLPAPLVKRLTAIAKSTARSLGDTSVKTAQVYGPDSRYALVKASSGDLVQKTVRERKGFYLIVLHGHFVCDSCTGPAGAKAPRGTIATDVWSPKAGGTDFGLSDHLPAAMSHLRGPTVIQIASRGRSRFRSTSAPRRRFSRMSSYQPGRSGA